MKKKLISVILAALILASAGTLFSCSESTENTETTAEDSTPSAAEEVVEETETENGSYQARSPGGPEIQRIFLYVRRR